MTINNIDININEFDYNLPNEKIAQYPLEERDMSKLLISNGQYISNDSFRNIALHIPKGSIMVFNNTSVIKARIIFRKITGSVIEVFCLEPLFPNNYEVSLSSNEPVEWECLVGNLKKWKEESLSIDFTHKTQKYLLTAKKISHEGDKYRIRFSWNCSDINFAEVLNITGHVPLPPYIERNDSAEDEERYQTVYSKIRGSVAAPTAGLHFTSSVIDSLKNNGTEFLDITLHVGAGTFQPVKTNIISSHKMHREHFFITPKTIKQIRDNHSKIIAVGTTSVRTLESLYWIGVKLLQNHSVGNNELSLNQWEHNDLDGNVTPEKSMDAILDFLKSANQKYLHASTSIMITPGYSFKIISGMITNFHQPRSTLLLLIAAWTGGKWKNIYDYALNNGFRFLSYGDSSLLL